MIGNDILDIGSRKAGDLSSGSKRQLGLSQDLLMGRPGAFDIPNVNDVSLSIKERERESEREKHQSIEFSSFDFLISYIFCSPLF